MKKIMKLQNLDCASCASKMENAIKKIDGIQEASVNFMTQKLNIEVEEEKYDTIMEEIKKVCKKVEPDCQIIDR